MFRPCSTTRRAVAAMSSGNVRPVIIESSPIKPGSWARQKSCNVPENCGVRYKMTAPQLPWQTLGVETLALVAEPQASSSNTPDGPHAMSAPAPPLWDRKSNRGCRACETSGAGWPACWHDGNQACRSNVGGSGCGNQGRTTRCNSGTSVASASDSLWPKTNTRP